MLFPEDRAAVETDGGWSLRSASEAPQMAGNPAKTPAGACARRMGGQSVIVLDTHALVWWVDDASKPSRKARQALRVHARRRELIVSATTVFEIVTLERRGRLQFKRPLREWLADLRKLPEIAVYRSPMSLPNAPEACVIPSRGTPRIMSSQRLRFRWTCR